MATFRLVLPSFPWSACLAELRACYSYALRQAGHAVTLSDVYDQNPYEVNVAFGAHAVAPPPGCVVFNSEHHARHFTPEYVGTLRRARLVVSMGPFDAASTLVPSAIVECPPGILPVYECDAISPFDFDDADRHVRDIDALFYGSVTPRRARILESLSAAGVQVTALYGVLGSERDRYIDRAKLVLDLKQDGDEPPDSTRSWWPLSRGACVLSENAPDRASCCRTDPDNVVHDVSLCLKGDDSWRAGLRQAYADALGPCDVTPMLKALGLAP